MIFFCFHLHVTKVSSCLAEFFSDLTCWTFGTIECHCQRLGLPPCCSFGDKSVTDQIGLTTKRGRVRGIVGDKNGPIASHELRENRRTSPAFVILGLCLKLFERELHDNKAITHIFTPYWSLIATELQFWRQISNGPDLKIASVK